MKKYIFAITIALNSLLLTFAETAPTSDSLRGVPLSESRPSGVIMKKDVIQKFASSTKQLKPNPPVRPNAENGDILSTTGDPVIDSKVRALQKEAEEKIQAIREEYRLKIKAVTGDKKVQVKNMVGSTTPRNKEEMEAMMKDRVSRATTTRREEVRREGSSQGTSSPRVFQQPRREGAVRGVSTSADQEESLSVRGFFRRFFGSN